MSPRVLLTGSTGFVGRQILRALHKSGVKIRVVQRVGPQDKLNTATPEDRVYTKDLFSESEDWWASACADIDIVIHAAWYVEPGKYLDSMSNIDCLSGSLKLAKGAVKAGVSRFIGLGTCFEYDLRSGYLSIDTPLMPQTLYAATKVATYIALRKWLAHNNVEFTWCRLFYLYGEGEDFRRLFPYIRSQILAGKTAQLTNGLQIRDYLDVSIAGEEISAIALGRLTGAVNICSGSGQTIREIAEKIADEYGRRDLLKFGYRKENITDPPCVVGIRSGSAEVIIPSDRFSAIPESDV